MKKLFASGLLSLTCLTSFAIDQFKPEYLENGGTNNVAAATSRSTSYIIDVSKQDNVALEVTFKCNDTNAYNLFITLQPTVTGLAFDTTQTKVLAIPANGTSTNTTVTNLSCAGIKGWKIASINNTNPTTHITNLSISYGIKR